MVARLGSTGAVVGAAALIAISLTPPSPALGQGQELFVKSDTVWRRQQIEVCWENPSTRDKTEREMVRDIVDATWASRSSLQFVGWGRCAWNSKGIRIGIADAGPHTKGLGSQLDGMENGMVLNFTFGNWSQSCQTTRRHCIEAIAVHEFGHALGFSHEHNRPDRDRLCQDAPQGTQGDVFVTVYDAQSVMNYCNNASYPQPVQISPRDTEGIQKLYGPPGGSLPDINTLLR